MCGIVALVGKSNRSRLDAMNAVQAHRGPDSAGHYISDDGRVSFAMRRLSIIDLESGDQPISNQSGTITLVCNGEIYNSPELRSDLERKGHQFKTRNSDVETIVHLYEEHGTDCLRFLNGMFGFVLHDVKNNLVFGARDRVGIKPLYYWRSGGCLALASELKSILQLPDFSPAVSAQSLYHYTTLLYVPDTESILEDVYRVPPGHYFVWDLNTQEFSLAPYWSPNFSITARDPEEASALVRTSAQAAVKRWTLSDVPIACSLSGGLDSASLVGLLAETGQKNIKTYTLGFSGQGEADWNETELARLVAKKWGTDHHEIILSPEGLLDDLISMVWSLEEPYGGGLPSWHVFKLMSQDVKVAMTGSGGDELFGNYHKPKFYEVSGLRRSAALARWLSRRNPGSTAELLKRFRALLRQGKQYPFGGLYPNQYKFFSDYDKRHGIFSMRTDGLEDTGAYHQRLFEASGADCVRNGLAAVDFRTQLAEEFLHMTDRFSMAHSLEARVPFLDHEFVETVFSIDPNLRSSHREMKYLLKRAMGDLLPGPLLTARKHGFTIPIGLWLRTRLKALAKFLLDADRLNRQGLFSPDFSRRYLEPHLSGQRDFDMIIWGMLMFQLWHLVFVEQRWTESPNLTISDLVN